MTVSGSKLAKTPAPERHKPKRRPSPKCSRPFAPLKDGKIISGRAEGGQIGLFGGAAQPVTAVE
jgi:hypothetical protein